MRLKIAFLLAVMFACFVAYGQKNVRLVYYLKNSGRAVATKDSADYWMVVDPPDSAIDKKLYVVYEYYPDGKVKLMTNSRSKDIDLVYQGKYIAYFADGRKKRTGTYDKQGRRTGHEVEYYSNGKLHSIVNYSAEGNIIYSECRDSTGKVTAENGKGDWRQFDETFESVIAEGRVDSGKRVGLWHLKQDSISLENKYDNGVLLTSLSHAAGCPGFYAKAEVAPAFPGGEEAFREFSSKTFVFPETATYKKPAGTTLVTFIVEENGMLTNFKMTGNVGYGMDEAELALMKKSPRWIPGAVNGKPVRSAGSHSFVITTTIVGRSRFF